VLLVTKSVIRKSAAPATKALAAGKLALEVWDFKKMLRKPNSRRSAMN
jgi:hypothetical protein